MQNHGSTSTTAYFQMNLALFVSSDIEAFHVHKAHISTAHHTSDDLNLFIMIPQIPLPMFTARMVGKTKHHNGEK